MTNYNTEDILESCLNSIITRITPEEFEIIIVDNKSKDRSPEILKHYSEQYNLKVISKKCLRGRGRQIAFENSNGDFIITADCDTIYNDNWIRLIRIYESKKFDFALSAWFTQIYPRQLLKQVGGWKNLQYWEDVELWCRIAKIDKYRTYPIICGENHKRVVSTNFLEKTYRRYRRVHDKALIASHISTYLWILTYWKIFKNKYGIIGTLRRFVYQTSILFVAKTISSYRRIFYEYGELTYLSNLKENIIDLSIGEMQIDKGQYDTKQGCTNAYKNGDYKYIP